MKKSRFFQLLKAEATRPVLIWLAYGLILSGMNIWYSGQMQGTQLNSSPTEVFRPVIILMTFFGIFKNGIVIRGQAPNASHPGYLEFLFTKAISRSTLFYAKSCLYLFVCLMPLAITLGHSYMKPATRVEFFRNSAGEKTRKEFYLTHFSGAHLEPAQKGRNISYVVLPKGRVDQAFFSLISSCAAAVIYQLASFLLWNKRWGQGLIFFSLITALYSSSLRSVSIKIVSGYETHLLWVSEHRLPILAGLALLAIATQIYCCRRFVKTEILS